MKKSILSARFPSCRDVAFQKALEPMEAAVLPAREHMRYGTLSMVPRAYDALRSMDNQRAKIWVR